MTLPLTFPEVDGQDGRVLSRRGFIYCTAPVNRRTEGSMTPVGLSAARRSWRAPRALAVAMAVVVFLSARSLFGQGVGATLLGTIADEQHGVLPGVTIT